MLCKWTTWTASNMTQIRLAGNFSLVGGTGGNCGGDFVNVYDGAESDLNLLSKLCGTSSDTLQSTGNLLTVVMKTDNSYTGKGFRFLFSETTDPLPCGESLTASLTNSYLTKKIRPNLHCTWLIDSGSADYIVMFEVLLASIISSDGCTDDYLAAYDGMSEASGVQLGKWCQDVDQMETKHSTQQYLTIVLHTNKEYSAGGFRLRYWRDAEPAEQGHATAPGSNIAAILGGIFGGLILFIIIVIFCVVRRPLSKGSSSGGGQATPGVAYQPKQQVANMQGSKYKVQGHAYSQPGPVKDQEVSQLLHVQEHA